MTSATLKTCYGEVTVTINRDDMSLTDLWDEVIEPLLLGSGYAQKSLNELVNPKD